MLASEATTDKCVYLPASPFDWAMDSDYVGMKIAAEVEERYNNPKNVRIVLNSLYYESVHINDPSSIDPHPFNCIRDLDMEHSSYNMYANHETFVKACSIYDQLDFIPRKDLLHFKLSMNLVFGVEYCGQPGSSYNTICCWTRWRCCESLFTLSNMP